MKSAQNVSYTAMTANTRGNGTGKLFGLAGSCPITVISVDHNQHGEIMFSFVFCTYYHRPKENVDDMMNNQTQI